MRIVTLACLLVLAAGGAQAAGHRLECPAWAPAEWGKLGPLDQVAVLSAPKGSPIDEVVPPSLVPDRGFAHGNAWHNIWRMGDEPGWVHFIQCQWRGSSRVLRLPADGLRQCEQTAAPYSRAHGVANDAVHTLSCD